jgi:hypothetical protein
MYTLILVKKIILSAVLFSEGIGGVNLPLESMNYVSSKQLRNIRVIENIRPVKPVKLPEGTLLPLGPTNKIPHFTDGITGALKELILNGKKNKLLLDLGRRPDATSETLSSIKELKPNIKKVLENKIFIEDPQTLLVFNAAKSQIRDVNNLTLGKCNDVIRKIEASKGIKISDADRLIIAAAILLGVVAIVV